MMRIEPSFLPVLRGKMMRKEPPFSCSLGELGDNEARSIPVNVVNVRHNEARSTRYLWENQGV